MYSRLLFVWPCNTFVYSAGSSGTRAGEEVQWAAGGVCGPAEDPPKAKEEPAHQTKAA